MRAPIEISLVGVCKAFDGHTVLGGIDLEIASGEIVAIVGGSGCGKTVLLNHILGQLEPDSGTVCVADHALADAPLVDLAGIDPGERDRLHTYWGVVF
ncbi:MAG: ATP-binding cassette domain-containing protein, partial [Rhodospirillales bacterium]